MHRERIEAKRYGIEPPCCVAARVGRWVAGWACLGAWGSVRVAQRLARKLR